MRLLYVRTRAHPDLLKGETRIRYHEPWGIWLFEDSEEAIRLDLRLRCQGYTVVVGEELDTFHLNWQDIYP